MGTHGLQIADDESAAVAEILPEKGFNCFRWSVPWQGRRLELLSMQAGFIEGLQPPTRSGIPILFPFAGRLRGLQYTWRGRQYDLSGCAYQDGQGNAIHGFVLNRPWRVLSSGKQQLTAEFQGSVDAPESLLGWPADYRITATYEVRGHQLSLHLELANPGQDDLPLSLGLHPYFALPLAGPRADACRIRVPADRHWQAEGMLPTGTTCLSERVGEMSAGRPFSQMQYDDVFQLAPANGPRQQAEIIDPAGKCRLVIEFDSAFPHCVVFNPPQRETVCVEPYSALPNAFELEQRGISTGQIVLPPGTSISRSLILRLESTDVSAP